MPIEIEKVVGAELTPTTYSWTEKDLILYNLGVGAGNPPTDPNELEYTYEASLKAIPSFGTIPPFAMMMSMGSLDGLDIELAQILHGDQRLFVHSPIPSSGMVTQTGRVTDVFDKGKGALMVLEVVSVLENTGQLLFTNRAGIFIRGEGGFGGDGGQPPSNRPPDREPDRVVESNTLPQQALLYRMVSGDGNPLHADPEFAVVAGFEQPILHGLCTYGVVLKAAVDEVLDGQANDVESYEARFSGHVFPGETLVCNLWEDEAGWVLSASVKERGKAVLSNARLTTRI